jgi:hypothetical protein
VIIEHRKAANSAFKAGMKASIEMPMGLVKAMRTHRFTSVESDIGVSSHGVNHPFSMRICPYLQLGAVEQIVLR